MRVGPSSSGGSNAEVVGSTAAAIRSSITEARFTRLALLWQNLAIDRRYWIPESGFQ